MLLGMVCGAAPLAAQEDECPPDAARAWLDAQRATFDTLLDLDAQATEALTLDLIVQMQTARRAFAQVDAPPCAYGAALYSHLLFANVIDYWIAMHAGEQSTASDIAAQNATWKAYADTAIEALQATLGGGGALGGALGGAEPSGAGQRTTRNRVLVWDDKDGYTALDGLAFVNDLDVVFADWSIDEEVLATLDDPEVGGLVVTSSSYICDEDEAEWMGRVIARLGDFVAGGGHLWIFYDNGWLECNEPAREHLGFTLVEDYEWLSLGVPKEAQLSWMADLEIQESGYGESSVYLMTRGEGDLGYTYDNDENERLVVTSYPHNGGRITLFPRFSYGPVLDDDNITEYQHEELALRIVQYLAGKPLPAPPAEPNN